MFLATYSGRMFQKPSNFQRSVDDLPRFLEPFRVFGRFPHVSQVPPRFHFKAPQKIILISGNLQVTKNGHEISGVILKTELHKKPGRSIWLGV